MKAETLSHHPFVKTAFGDMRIVMKERPELFPGSRYDSEALADEYEFYLLRIGNALARLLTECNQLEHGVLLMSVYRDSAALREAGVNRVNHLIYHVESYIVRTQIVYDRALRLVDRFFHLGNKDSELRHQTIVSNFRVKNTTIPSALKALSKHLRKYADDRHEIVHRGNFQDEELDNLEMFALLEASGQPDPELNSLPELRKERTREFIRSKKHEYQQFNTQTYKLVGNIFSECEKLYEQERLRVARVTGRKATRLERRR